jgi:hypothetical protein
MSARGIPLQLPQDRVVANRHPEPSHQALAGSAAGAMAEQTETTQPSSSVSATPRTFAPGPGDHFVFNCMPVHSGIMSNGE